LYRRKRISRVFLTGKAKERDTVLVSSEKNKKENEVAPFVGLKNHSIIHIRFECMRETTTDY